MCIGEAVSSCYGASDHAVRPLAYAVACEVTLRDRNENRADSVFGCCVELGVRAEPKNMGEVEEVVSSNLTRSTKTRLEPFSSTRRRTPATLG